MSWDLLYDNEFKDEKCYIENGMIDKNTHTYPDVIKMLQTCKLQEVKKEYEDLLFDNFSVLHKVMKNKDHIPKDIYVRLWFMPNTNYAEETVNKPDRISQEIRHRAKILSHSLQRELWQKTKTRY